MGWGYRFQSGNQPQCKHWSLWHQYVWERQFLRQLSRKIGRSIPWIRSVFALVPLPLPVLPPQPLVGIADVRYFGKRDGCLVVRAPHFQENIFWRFTEGESPVIYREARRLLEKQVYRFTAMVLDDRMGAREAFPDISVQMCHFHQKAIIRRYLTLHPKLLAGAELLAMGRTLTFVTEKGFQEFLLAWFSK